MAKRSKQAKKKRKSARARKKKLAQEQRFQRERALARDLQVLADRGVFDDEKQFGDLLRDALWGSEAWREEPQFQSLAFDPREVGSAMSAVWEARSELDEAAAGDSEEALQDELLEQYFEASKQLLTPKFKKDFLRRLEQFRRRLRSRGDTELLAKATIVQMALTDLPVDESEDDIWVQCMLLYAIFGEALAEYLRLVEAAEDLLQATKDSLEDVAFEEFLDQPEQHPAYATLSDAVKATPGLEDFLRGSTADLVKEASTALLDSEIHLGLYTIQEIDAFSERVVDELEMAGLSPEDMSSRDRGEKTQVVAGAMFRSVVGFLEGLDAAGRRGELYETARSRCKELTRNQDQIAAYAAAIRLELDDEVPLAENPVFIGALIGEYGEQARDADKTEVRSGWRARAAGFARRVFRR